MEKVRYMISDAANIVNVESHVLRYWEDELKLDIPRNELGHRYYTKENIKEFERIKELKEQGYQLKAIRMIVHNGPLDGLTAEEQKQSAVAEGMPGQAVTAEKVPSGQADAASTYGKAEQTAAAPGKPLQAKTGHGKTQPPVQQVENQVPAKRVSETPQSILDNTDKMAQFTDLMTRIVGQALAANNEELSQNISEEVGKQVIKEMNYLMREREEAEEERFRKLDAAIRGNLKKKDEDREKKFWKKKKPSQA